MGGMLQMKNVNEELKKSVQKYFKKFDEDKYAYNHFGWHGVKTMSVNDVKRWCENYIAEKYIINYEEELQELQKRKEVSDWFVNQGYGNLNKEDEQEMEL